MTFPDDLPSVLVYLLGIYPDRTGQNGGRPTEIVLATYPRRPVVSISTSGNTDASTVRPTIPYGCKGWRVLGETAWKPLKDLPRPWMPFLMRERGTAHDPRRPFCPGCGDAAGSRGENGVVRCPWCLKKEARRAASNAAQEPFPS